MKIKCERDELVKNIQLTQGILSSQTTLPILSYYLISVQKGDILLISTDLEIGIKSNIKGKVIEEGDVVVPGRKISELIREFPSGEIDISSEENMVSLRCNTTWVKISTLSVEDFPKFPQVGGKEIIIPGKTIKSMLKSTIFAVSREDSRYSLNGIYLLVDNQRVRLVATDGKRLALKEEKKETSLKGELEVIVPLKACNEVRRIVTDADVSLVVGEKQLKIAQEGMCLTTRLIEDEFPNYEEVIPRTFQGRVEIEKEQFQQAIRRALVLTREEGSSVKLSFLPDGSPEGGKEGKKGKMIITTRVPEVGESSEEMSVIYEGPEEEVAFSPQYLLDIIQAIEDENIFIGLNEVEEPVVIRPSNDASYTNVIMPMRR